MSAKNDMIIVRVSWPKGWMLIVPVPRIGMESVINRFDHFKLDVHAYVSHIDWVINTAKEIRVKSERVAYNAGWV